MNPIARIVTCIADKVFGAVDAALFTGFDLDTRKECRAPSSLWCLGCQADMCGWPDQDGAAQLAAREAENEVHEPK